MNTRQRAKISESVPLDDNPQWYKDAVIYEIHVRAYCDGNGDGIGDFPGLTEKLEFLQDLGVTVLWLLPFYPSPLKDDGYDIADYTNIHPDYGTLQDFRLFLREAHRYGIRVITELVINHTSDQHPWFQRAREAPPGSSARNFYVWSDTQDKYQEAEENLRKGLDIIRHVLGEENPDTASCWNNLAYTLGRRGRDREAEEANRKLTDLRWSELSPDEVRLLESLYDAETASLDAHLRDLFRALEKRGVLDKAIVVITATCGAAMRQLRLLALPRARRCRP